MPDYYFPKIWLFGLLSHSRPLCELRRRRRDLVKHDLMNAMMSDGYWYDQEISGDLFVAKE